MRSVRREPISARTPQGDDIFWNGTGYLFRTTGGTSAIATAAHNLYHPQRRLRAQAIEVNFGRDGGSTVGQRAMRSCFYRQQFVQTGGSPEWDYGVIEVDALPLDQFPEIPLILSTAAGDTRKLLAGYPDAGGCKDTFIPYHATFTVFPCSASNYGYRNQVTYTGMSGGPLLGRTDDDALVSYGIHVRGPASANPNAPRAIRFSASILQDMQGWA